MALVKFTRPLPEPADTEVVVEAAIRDLEARRDAANRRGAKVIGASATRSTKTTIVNGVSWGVVRATNSKEAGETWLLPLNGESAFMLSRPGIPGDSIS